MLSNTWSLIGSTAVTSGLGFAYWWVAARQYSTEAVGLSSASISTMTLLGTIGMFGLGTLLITELPRQPGQEVSLISTGLVVVGTIGVIIGVLFAIFAPDVSSQFLPLRANILDIVIFAAGVSLTAVTAVLDQALIGVLQGNLQFWRNFFFSLVKLVLLFAAGWYLLYTKSMATYGTWTIYASWTVGMALSLFVVFGYSLIKRGWQGKAYLPRWQLLRKLGLAALQHHLLNMALRIPTQFLPVLVTALLSAQTNAWFYVSWMVANFVYLVPNSLTVVLHAMSSAEQSSLSQRARMTMGIAFAVCLAADAVLFLGAKQVLSLFGPAYAEQASWCLRILVLAAFPSIIKNHYISFCRIRDRLARAMIGMLVGGAFELGCAMLGAYLGGLLGLCLSWVIAVTIESLCMLPLVYKVIWPAKNAPEVVVPEHEDDSLWLVDTLILPVYHTSTSLPALPKTSVRKPESIWLFDTLTQSAISPAPAKFPDTPSVSKNVNVDEIPTSRLPIVNASQGFRQPAENGSLGLKDLESGI